MPKSIEIPKLSIEELIELNRKVVERVQELQQRQSYKNLVKFKVGDRVRFTPPDRTPVEGVIERLNKKTVSIVAGDNSMWRVSPHLLTKIIYKRKKSTNPLRLVSLKL